MRGYWILPNRDQGDEILASDGERTLPLRQIVAPKLRPAGFSHGVPTELMQKCRPGTAGDILFAQRFPGDNSAKELLCVSTTAGLDSSGRVVHLGLLFLLEPGERPRFELSTSGLSEQDRPCANALIHRMTFAGPGDPWGQSVRELIERPLAGGPIANVALERSVVPCQSLYVLGPGGLIRQVPSRRHWFAIPLTILMVTAVLGAALALSERNCSADAGSGGRVSSSAVRNGVVGWRFN